MTILDGGRKFKLDDQLPASDLEEAEGHLDSSSYDDISVTVYQIYIYVYVHINNNRYKRSLHNVIL